MLPWHLLVTLPVPTRHFMNSFIIARGALYLLVSPSIISKHISYFCFVFNPHNSRGRYSNYFHGLMKNWVTERDELILCSWAFLCVLPVCAHVRGRAPVCHCVMLTHSTLTGTDEVLNKCAWMRLFRRLKVTMESGRKCTALNTVILRTVFQWPTRPWRSWSD